MRGVVFWLPILSIIVMMLGKPNTSLWLMLLAILFKMNEY